MSKIVILYTMKGCPHCSEIKKMLKESKINYDEKDIDDYKEEYNNFVILTKNEYLPALTLLEIKKNNDPKVKLITPDDDFKDLNEAVDIIKNFLLD